MNKTFHKFILGSFIYEFPQNNENNCFPIEISLTPGNWLLECWGASGGSAYHNDTKEVVPGGKGGYSVGVLKLTTETKAFLNIGGEGASNETETVEGGCNGGGSGYAGNYLAASGGGGTDIRLFNNTLDNRIIVAGGGGGAGCSNHAKPGVGFGGSGGGTSGLDGGGHFNSYDDNSGHGGNQLKGGEKASYNNVDSKEGLPGQGGDPATSTYSSAGGGGGGYFGGSGGVAAGGGGGSGYIGGVSSYWYYKAKTKNGNTSFPSPFNEREIGHLGNGVIKITYLPMHIKTCNKKSAQFITKFVIITVFVYIIVK